MSHSQFENGSIPTLEKHQRLRNLTSNVEKLSRTPNVEIANGLYASIKHDAKQLLREISDANAVRQVLRLMVAARDEHRKQVQGASTQSPSKTTVAKAEPAPTATFHRTQRKLQVVDFTDIDERIGQGKNVLVVEDEFLASMQIRDAVFEAGHNIVAIARTQMEVEDLIDLIDKSVERPQLLIADVQLADGSSGIDVAHRLSELYQIPIVFVTAYPAELLQRKLPPHSHFQSKPFQRDMLAQTVRMALA